MPQDINNPTFERTELEDGSVEINLEPSKQVIQNTIPQENINLVPMIRQFTEPRFLSYYDEKQLLTGEEILKQIGQVTVDEFGIDDESRSTWKENTAEQVKLFTSFMEKKTFPWDNCSNVNLPLLTYSSLQFHARAYEALFPPKSVVQCIATGDEDEERAERVAKYMNYQLYYKDEYYEDGMDTSLIQLPLYGSVFRKTYFDEERELVTTVPVCADDFVINYGARSIETAQRHSHILRKHLNEIRRKVILGIYDAEAWNFKEPSYSEPTPKVVEAIDKSIGISDSNQGLSRIFIEQHRYWDIDGDGIAEPVTVVVDKETCKVIRITDRTCIDEKGKKQTIVYFTHYVFFPNPEGFYGLGFGTLLRGLNESGNTIVNEVIDAGSLANLQGGFIAKRSGLKKGTLKFKMGEYQEVDTYMDDLKKAIFSFDFKGPNQTLYAVLGLLFEYSKLVSSISETMTGQLPASDTPAHTVLALIEEGRKVFSSIHKRTYRSFKKELRKMYRLNGLYLDEVEYYKVLGDNNVPMGPPLQTGRTDFVGNLDVIPVADPNIISKAEKIIKAEQLLKNVLENPFTVSNQQLQFTATTNFYTAIDAPQSMIKQLTPAEPPDLSPEDENAQIITEKPATVLPKQDHLHHLDIHNDLITGTFAESLSPTAKKLIEQHNREHIAGLYTQQKGGTQVGTQG